MFHFLDLPWVKEVVTQNSQRQVPIHCARVPESEPERMLHEEFRSWQINQPFQSFEGKNRKVLDHETARRISELDVVTLLGYDPMNTELE
jgi:hypothetical protein